LGFPLRVKKVESQEIWDFKITVTLVLFYFFVLYPGIQFFYRGYPWTPQYAYLTIFSAALFYVLGIKKIPLNQLGFSIRFFKNHLLIGLISGGLIVCALPLLDALISISGLDANELFSESVKQREVDDEMTFQPLNILGQVFLFPVSKQCLLTGLIFIGLKRQFKPILAIYGTAVIFTLVHFQLNLGTFALGLITALLYHWTGTLYASILFHASCSLAGLILLNVYPRLTTLLVFLF
jgi:membrane protease YdiL (CAAX protease family)